MIMASKFWSVVTSLLILASFSSSRAVSKDHLSEIDKDLASILNEADTPETDADIKIDKSGFLPVGESAKDTKRAEPDKTLEDEDRTFKEILDHISKDEGSRMDAADRFGSKLPQDNDDKTDDIPKELLDDLNSDAEENDKKEKLAELLLDVIHHHERQKHRNDEGHKDESHKDDEKELLNSLNSEPGKDDEQIPSELLNDLESGKRERVRDPGFDNNDDPIPKDLLDDLKQDEPVKNTARDKDCDSECKKEALRNILMDELVSRMTSIAKRGDKIPRRMFELWRKYRTKRDDTKKNTKISNLMM